jgi:hypothetical protein
LYAVGVERGDPDAALEFLNYLKKNSDPVLSASAQQGLSEARLRAH